MISVMNNTNDLGFGGDCTRPRVESEADVVNGSSLENRESASVHLIGSSEEVRDVHGDEKGARSVAGGGTGSLNGSGVDNRGAGDSNSLGAFEFNDKDVFSDRNHSSVKNGNHVQQKGGRAEVGKSDSSVYGSMLTMFDEFAANGSMEAVVGPSKEVLSPGHGFEVGDMVWGKVKSHPWWPGHVYSQEFATQSVRRSKRDGLLLVAFFGDSSYGWFHPSELIPFDSNYAEKSCQTNSRTFVKAVEEAVDEVSRRRALGLSCMCRNKKNFRQTNVQGFFAVDVADYEPGAVYSRDVIGKARKSFQPRLALDFVRHLALAPTSSEHAGIEFIKNRASVMSYRKAIYEEFDETYAQAFGHQPSRSPSGTGQELASAKKPSKAPLSGRQVFAETPVKAAKSIVKPYKPPKDQAKKDKYLFKRRDEHSSPIAAIDDYVLQKRVPETNEQTNTTDSNGELVASIEDTPTVVKYGNNNLNESSISSSLDEEEKNVKVRKHPIEEVATEPMKKKKKKKEPDGTPLVAKVQTVQAAPMEEPQRIDVETQKMATSNHEVDLPHVLADLQALALDPFHVIERGRPIRARQVFLKFRSLVFQKSLTLSLSPPVEDDPNVEISREMPPVKPQPRPLGRPDDPTKGGRKRGPSDRQEDIAAKKKKKVNDIRNLTTEKKVTQVITKNPPEATGKPATITTARKSGPESVQRAPEPTMLTMKFPSGGSLPSINELKAKFARFGPMDHSATRIFWNTFTCRVVFRSKAHAVAAYKSVIGSSTLFGNTDVKCHLKEVGDSEPPLKADAAAGNHQQPPPQLKSCLKKSGEEAGGSNGNRGMPRVKFMLGGEETSFPDAAAPSSSSHSTMDFNSKNLQKTVFHSPPPTTTTTTTTTTTAATATTSLTTQFIRPPPPQPPLPPLPPPQLPVPMHYEIAPPPPPPPPRPVRNVVHNLNTPPLTPNVDIAQQMLSLLTKCNDVVTNVTGLLGYVPYHPL